MDSGGEEEDWITTLGESGEREGRGEGGHSHTTVFLSTDRQLSARYWLTILDY